MSARKQSLPAELIRVGLRPALTVQPAGDAGPAAEIWGDC